MTPAEPFAWFGGTLATGLCELTDKPDALDSGGWWAVCVTYEGRPLFARFADICEASLPAGRWLGPQVSDWTSSLDEPSYVRAVDTIKSHIAAGDIYQGNVCRVLRAALPDTGHADPAGLAALLLAGNPAPFAGVISISQEDAAGLVGVDVAQRLIPDWGMHIVTASPELFLARNGSQLTSQPIKGTAPTAELMLAKDISENVMIVDLVRNDLSVVCEPGSVDVPDLVVPQEHPGLVHLVSTVTGRLRESAGWEGIFDATFPPGSVTGCPKPRAIELLAQVETSARGPYCGAIGWIDADSSTATLAVGIRTFWIEGNDLCFGVGAGITADSDPVGEWQETQLKARNLLKVASGRYR